MLQTDETNQGNEVLSGREEEVEEKTYAGLTRRKFCLGVGAAAALVGLGALRYVGSAPLIRPPGGQDESLLLASCIHCGKCYEICPHNLISPTHLEDGFFVMRTPTMNFSKNYCDWCSGTEDGFPLCVKVCPTQALKLPASATSENTIIGKAVINTDWCLAYRLIGCHFCVDACPHEAMALDENGLPLVITDRCNGCGACESVCVSLQDGSISTNATDRAIIVKPIERLKV